MNITAMHCKMAQVECKYPHRFLNVDNALALTCLFCNLQCFYEFSIPTPSQTVISMTAAVQEVYKNMITLPRIHTATHNKMPQEMHIPVAWLRVKIIGGS